MRFNEVNTPVDGVEAPIVTPLMVPEVSAAFVTTRFCHCGALVAPCDTKTWPAAPADPLIWIRLFPVMFSVWILAVVVFSVVIAAVVMVAVPLTVRPGNVGEEPATTTDVQVSALPVPPEVRTCPAVPCEAPA